MQGHRHVQSQDWKDLKHSTAKEDADHLYRPRILPRCTSRGNLPDSEIGRLQVEITEGNSRRRHTCAKALEKEIPASSAE